MQTKTLSKMVGYRKALLALLVAFGVTACGGGGSGNNGFTAAEAPNGSPMGASSAVETLSAHNTTHKAAFNSTFNATQAVRIEAEDYIDYHDNSPGNEGGAYRSDNVDIEITTDEGGGYNVGWTEPGEWLEYEVLLAAGTYEVYGRVASETDYGAFSVALNGQPFGGLQVGNTGGWQNWDTHWVGEVSVSQFDIYRLRVDVSGGDFNLNWIDLVPISSGGGPVLELEEVSIVALADGGAEFSLMVPEPKDVVHVFARRNGAQDFAQTDIQNNPESVVDNGDGTFTYRVARSGVYLDGDVIEARFYTFSANSGQVFYPGPGDSAWESLNYDGNNTSDPGDPGGPGDPGDPGEPGEPGEPGGPSDDYSVGPYVPGYDPNYTPQPVGGVMPLFHQGTPLEAVITYETEDALITRISDRGRDRHAKEDHFQAYDHYLSFYWEDRTAAIEIVDKVAKGGSTIRMNVRTEFRLNDTEAENRWFYRGVGTVAEYCDNGTMEVIDDLNYYKERSHNCREGRAIQVGDKLEFELSQFLAPNVPNGRAAYYGTTYLYIVGEGLVPWDVGGSTPAGGIKDSVKIPESAWLGGNTTIHADTSNEPHNRFMQMATNIGYENAQRFVEGRRILHTSFVDGTHDELPWENPVFTELVGTSGPRYINEACTDCHVRNGRAVPAPIGEHLDQWVFQVGDEHGHPHPDLGRVLQREANSGAASEGGVYIASWTNESNGLRSPNYEFTGVTPDRYSARISPQLVGMGLLEAIPEEAILALEDPHDSNGNGISGRAHRVLDPETGETRLGRFGWKAGKISVKHQIAAALNTDMGVMTSVLPHPDCGSAQHDCGPSGSNLGDDYLDKLVTYVSLLGVPPQRDYDDPAVQRGETLFDNMGCAGCHTPSFQTSAFHPLAELRDQTIYPYTDLLLHDMGPGLADNLGEGDASGAEWRTAPLWGLGHTACVVGGMNDAGQGNRVCTPQEGYLHDGRARTIEEAILWHGGEGEASKQAYQALSAQQKDDVLRFLHSL